MLSLNYMQWSHKEQHWYENEVRVCREWAGAWSATQSKMEVLGSEVKLQWVAGPPSVHE